VAGFDPLVPKSKTIASGEAVPDYVVRRTLVDYRTTEPAGTIIVDTPNTYLYLPSQSHCYSTTIWRCFLAVQWI
jgi:lipoprotein-anchoring transpeptidase ErfK/SrfK